VTHNKTPTQTFCGNFGTYGPILIILSPLHPAMNSGRNFHVIRHLSSNLQCCRITVWKLNVQLYKPTE